MTNTPEQGDYVNYIRYFDDGIGTGMETGAGYVVGINKNVVTIRNGDRIFSVLPDNVTMRAKQYRLDI